MTKKEREWLLWLYETYSSPERSEESKRMWGDDYLNGFTHAIKCILSTLGEDDGQDGQDWNGKMKVTIHEKTFDEEVVEADKISLNDWRIKIENRGKEPIFYGTQAISYIEITKKGD